MDEFPFYMITDEDHYFRPILEAWLEHIEAKGKDVSNHYRDRLRGNIGKDKKLLEVMSELMAAYFLEKRLGFDLTPVLPSSGAGRTPDFRARKMDAELHVEVKTVSGGLRPGRYCGPVPDSAPIIKKALDSATTQLPKNETNLLLIADWYRPPLDEFNLVNALYGTYMLSHQMGPDGPVGEWMPDRLPNGRCKPCINTRFGAVGVIRWMGGPNAPGVFIHNAYARKPIPAGLFDPLPQLVCNADRTGLEWRNGDWRSKQE